MRTAPNVRTAEKLPGAASGVTGPPAAHQRRAAADDQHVVSLVLRRFDQPVDDLRLVFTRDTELARCPASTNGEQHAGRAVILPGRAHDESRSLPLDRLDALTVADGEAGLAPGCLPDLQQRFFGRLAEVQFADDRKGDR